MGAAEGEGGEGLWVGCGPCCGWAGWCSGLNVPAGTPAGGVGPARSEEGPWQARLGRSAQSLPPQMPRGKVAAHMHPARNAQLRTGAASWF